MSKPTFFIIILISSVLVIFGALTYKVLVAEKSKVHNPNQIINQDGTLNIPINIDNPRVLSSKINFYIEGVIDSLQKQDGNVQITLKPGIKNLPPLVTDPNTDYFQMVNSEFIQKKVGDLKAGQTVRMSIYYGIKDRRWWIRRINII